MIFSTSSNIFSTIWRVTSHGFRFCWLVLTSFPTFSHCWCTIINWRATAYVFIQKAYLKVVAAFLYLLASLTYNSIISQRLSPFCSRCSSAAIGTGNCSCSCCCCNFIAICACNSLVPLDQQQLQIVFVFTFVSMCS